MTNRALLIPFLAASLFAAAPADYSADMVALQGSEVLQTMKLHVSGLKSRVEGFNAAPMGRIVTIARRDRGVTWTLFLDRRQYSEKPITAAAGKPDLANFDLAGLQKEVLGRETALGYACTKMRVTFGRMPNGRPLVSTVWVADSLGLPVRLEAMGFVQENRNLRVGAQPAYLFEIPAGFARTGAPGLHSSSRVPTTPAASAPAWKDRTNYPGGDFLSIDMATSNPTACKAACDKDPRCKCWTLVKPESPGGMGYCWLKDSIPPLVAEDCCVSGLKGASSGAGAAATSSRYNLEENINRYGEDYRDFLPSRADPEVCAEACSKESRCRAWTWVRDTLEGPNGHCWLKNPAPPQSPDDCCVSGLKQ